MKRALASFLATSLFISPAFPAGNPARSRLYDVQFMKSIGIGVPAEANEPIVAATPDGDLLFAYGVSGEKGETANWGNFGGWDIKVVRYSTMFNRIEWSVVVGGKEMDTPLAIAMLPSGQVAVAGETTSNDFPVTINAMQRANAGQSDVFIAVLSSDGRRFEYGTYFGDTQTESVLRNCIAVDDAGAVYIAGQTSSSHLPGDTGSIVTGKTFVTKVDPDFNRPFYTLRFDLSYHEFSLAVNKRELYIAMMAYPSAKLEKSLDQRPLDTSQTNFVYTAKFQANGFFEYGRFIAGPQRAQLHSRNLAVTDDGYVYLAVQTVDEQAKVVNDGLYRLDPRGYSSFVAPIQDIRTIAIDAKQRIVVAGFSGDDFVATANAFQKGRSSTDFALRVVDPSGDILYATIFGGASQEDYPHVFIDKAGQIQLFGRTHGTSVPGAAMGNLAAISGNKQAYFTSLWRANRLFDFSLEAIGNARVGTAVQLRAVVKEDGRVVPSEKYFKKWKVLGKNEQVHLDNEAGPTVMVTFDAPGSYYFGGEFDPMGLNAPLLTVHVSDK